MSVAPYWATPKLRNDSWYKVPFANSTSAVHVCVLNRLLFVPFVIASRIRLEQVGVEVVTAQGAASVGRLGIWKNLGAEFPQPGELLVQCTSTVDLNDDASKQALAIVDPLNSSNAYVDLKQGLYWVGFNTYTAGGTATLQGDSNVNYPPGVVLPVDSDGDTAFSSVTTDSDGVVWAKTSVTATTFVSYASGDLTATHVTSVPRFYLGLA
jgi:hypothetical protein